MVLLHLLFRNQIASAIEMKENEWSFVFVKAYLIGIFVFYGQNHGCHTTIVL